MSSSREMSSKPLSSSRSPSSSISPISSISKLSSSSLGISSSSVISAPRSISSASLPNIAKSSTKSVGKNGFLRVCEKPSTNSASREHIYNDFEKLTFSFNSANSSLL